MWATLLAYLALVQIPGIYTKVHMHYLLALHVTKYNVGPCSPSFRFQFGSPPGQRNGYTAKPATRLSSNTLNTPQQLPCIAVPCLV